MSGRFQLCETVNRNNRVYPRKVWESHCLPESDFMKSINQRRVFGQLEHPRDGKADLNQAAIVITDLKMEDDGEIAGTLETMTTEAGLKAKAIFEDGLTVGISSRARGSVKRRDDGVMEVQNDFVPETFDLVAEPSTPGALLHEDLQKSLTEKGEEAIRKEEAKAICDIQLQALREDVESKEFDSSWESRLNDIKYLTRTLDEPPSSIQPLEEAIQIKGQVRELRQELLTEAPAVLAAMASKAGRTLAQAERYWDDAKKQADKEIAKGRKFKKGKYAYIMGIVKKRLGLKESTISKEAISGGAANLVIRHQIPATVNMNVALNGDFRDTIPAGTSVSIVSTWDSEGSCKSAEPDGSLYGVDIVGLAISPEVLPTDRQWTSSPEKQHPYRSALVYSPIGSVMSATGLDEQYRKTPGKNNTETPMDIKLLIEEAEGAAAQAKASAEKAAVSAEVASKEAKQEPQEAGKAEAAAAKAKIAAAEAQAAADVAKSSSVPEQVQAAAEVAKSAAEKAEMAAQEAGMAASPGEPEMATPSEPAVEPVSERIFGIGKPDAEWENELNNSRAITMSNNAELAAKTKVINELRQEVVELRRSSRGLQTENANLKTLNHEMVRLFEEEILKYEKRSWLSNHPQLKQFESLLDNAKSISALQESAKKLLGALKKEKTNESTEHDRNGHADKIGGSSVSSKSIKDTPPKKLMETTDVKPPVSDGRNNIPEPTKPKNEFTRLREYRERKERQRQKGSL